MSKISLARAAILCCITLGGGFAAAQDGPVSTGELKEKWIGKTVSVIFPNAYTAKLQMESDFTMQISGGYNDVGKWRWHEPSGYCATWNKLRAREERCLTVTRKGAEYQVFNPDGTLNGTVTGIK
ncbi:MAG: hypothetical protein K0Q43_2719 [Ramlibacter sp.]|jgi:hypothetical protein|nr:hypothetical protein [Ramlibacter sp.]